MQERVSDWVAVAVGACAQPDLSQAHPWPPPAPPVTASSTLGTPMHAARQPEQSAKIQQQHQFSAIAHTARTSGNACLPGVIYACENARLWLWRSL